MQMHRDEIKSSFQCKKYILQYLPKPFEDMQRNDALCFVLSQRVGKNLFSGRFLKIENEMMYLLV